MLCQWVNVIDAQICCTLTCMKWYILTAGVYEAYYPYSSKIKINSFFFSLLYFIHIKYLILIFDL